MLSDHVNLDRDVIEELKELGLDAGRIADAQPNTILARHRTVQQPHAFVEQLDIPHQILPNAHPSEIHLGRIDAQPGRSYRAGRKATNKLIESAVEIGKTRCFAGRRAQIDTPAPAEE